MLPVPFDPELIDFIRRILSVAETGNADGEPGATYFYNDGPGERIQATLGIGFTASGDLKVVLQRYVDAGGAFAPQFAPYIAVLPHDLLPHNEAFAALCKKAAAEDPLFASVQHDAFDDLYLARAFQWAAEHGFQLPLSYLVIADSYLHSGSMLGFLMDEFAEPKPSNGGDEKRWITEYLKARKNWLANHPNRILRATVYRVNCYLGEEARDDWNMGMEPIVMNGTPVRVA